MSCPFRVAFAFFCLFPSPNGGFRSSRSSREDCSFWGDWSGPLYPQLKDWPTLDPLNGAQREETSIRTTSRCSLLYFQHPVARRTHHRDIDPVWWDLKICVQSLAWQKNSFLLKHSSGYWRPEREIKGHNEASLTQLFSLSGGQWVILHFGQRKVVSN